MGRPGPRYTFSEPLDEWLPNTTLGFLAIPHPLTDDPELFLITGSTINDPFVEEFVATVARLNEEEGVGKHYE
jgi:hypothetical protein